ncbi:MAG: DUF1398 family protein [Cytophagaceae bacterium]
MFTLEQIKEAHSKVKTGADFPVYIQELKKLGLVEYDVYVVDGHTNYYGEDGHHVVSSARYSPLNVANKCQLDEFKTRLKNHQQGKTDYPTFISDCATTGIKKWIIDFVKMTCTYFDKEGNPVLVEKIPAA